MTTETSYQIAELTKVSDMTLVMSLALFEELGKVIRYPHLRSYATYQEHQVERFLEAIKRSSLWLWNTGTSGPASFIEVDQ